MRFALLRDDKGFAGVRRGKGRGRREGSRPGQLAQGPAINQGLLELMKHHVQLRTLCWAQKAPEENEISVSDATKGNRENQLLPIFRPHNPFPGVCLANTAL